MLVVKRQRMIDHRFGAADTLEVVATTDSEPGRRVLLIAAGTIEDAGGFAARRQLDVAGVLGWRQLLRSPRSVRILARREGVESVIVHTRDWERQRMPQLYELALAVTPARTRLIFDERSGTMIDMSGRRLARRVLQAPLEVAGGLAGSAAEVVRFLAHERRFAAERPRTRATLTSSLAPQSMLAIWPGVEGAVGGSITHISGILDGFRRQGLRVGLVTGAPPPDQLADVVDDIVLTPPLSPGARIEKIPEALALNATIRAAVAELAPRLRPAFVYQRHRWFHVAGLAAARSLGVPLVLEWNASAAWQFSNWATRPPGAQAADPLLRAMERSVAREADLVAAVSSRAAEMAWEAGASPERVIVSPNGVNVEAVQEIVRSAGPRARSNGTTLGWSGSFGPWHGTEVLIQAMAHLPSSTRAVLVGNGAERDRCLRLATELGVVDRIEWTGTLAWKETIRRLNECDLLVIPHAPMKGRPFFGSPTKMFEYMALGRPIVASRLEQIGEILEDGRTAVMVEPGDPVALAAGIRSVLDRPDGGASLGEAALAEARAGHAWEHRAAAIVEHLRAGSR